MLEEYFFTIDLVVAVSLPLFVHLSKRSDPAHGYVVRLFWLGVAVGLLWEVPIFLSASFATDPVIGFLREPPLHPIVFMFAHALWDGGLFLAGIALVRTVCGDPVLATFRWPELAVLTLWGQVSAIAVEVVSVLNQGWFYHAGHAWNPVLFHLGGHPLTIVPQLVWLAAPVVYYFAALRLLREAVTIEKT